MTDNLIYFSDEELEQLGYTQEGNTITIEGEKYTIKSAVDNVDMRGYKVVKNENICKWCNS